MTEEKKVLDGIYVAQVPSTTTELIINKGREDGINADDRFFIRRFEEYIKDPITKENLERLEHIVGTARVKHLQNKITTIISDMKKPTFFQDLPIFGSNEDNLLPFNNPKIGDEVILKRRIREVSTDGKTNKATIE
ncbi:hypothetical protein [Cloacibacillus evryensis]|uniref:hypothetical protein n=1 Tax=Cloacibacillus evryensis TaxID=508460 RepID=UPI0024200236|nr:hypothetical protein [Cloacibacillus evryensis]